MLRDIFDVCTIKKHGKREVAMGGKDIGMITIAGPSGKEVAKLFVQPQDVLQEIE